MPELDSEPRMAYEMHLGKRVSDSHWSHVKNRLISQGLTVDNDTVVFYARISQIIPRSCGIAKALQAYNRAERLLLAPHKITGLEVLDIFAREGINPHPSTVTRWFKDAGGFRRNRKYLPEKLVPVLARAFVFKASQTDKLSA